MLAVIIQPTYQFFLIIFNLSLHDLPSNFFSLVKNDDDDIKLSRIDRVPHIYMHEMATNEKQYKQKSITVEYKRTALINYLGWCLKTMHQ